MDNRYVVPYNRYLLKKFQCHINTEIVTSPAQAVKYVFKYIFKGHDLANIRVNGTVNDRENRNEIQEYIQGRYVSSVEAYWKMGIGFIVKVWPSVERLSIHLPGEEVVQYDETADLHEIRQPITKLTAYFRFNKQVMDTFLESEPGPDTPLPDILTKTYVDFPSVACWNQREKTWTLRRTNTQCVGRLYTVHFSQQEKFHLWLLLKHVRGPTSYDDLLLGHHCFADACRSLGLLQDDQQWHIAMEEASAVGMPRQVRYFFSQILAFNEVADPSALWEAFKHAMSDDYLNQDELDPGHIQHDETGHWSWYALSHIRLILTDEFDKNFRGYHLPEIPEQYLMLPGEDLPVLPEEEIADLEHSLNPLQRQAYEEIMGAIESRESSCKTYFLDGIGGSGKTYLYKCLIHRLRRQGKDTIAVASSGLAAMLLPNGMTGHKMFKVPIKVDRSSICLINRGSAVADKIKQASLIIWDEAPMMSQYVFKAVDRTLRDLMQRPNHPFGGKVFVLGGDFRQCLPVVPHGSPADVVSMCLNKVDFWDQVRILRLHTNMRVEYFRNRGDEQLAAMLQGWTEYLLRVGDGVEPQYPPDHPLYPGWINAPVNIASPYDNELDFIKSVYADYRQMTTIEEKETFLRSTAICCVQQMLKLT